MITLILETSSPKGLISLADHQKIWAQKEVPFGVRQSVDLVSELQDLFESQGLTLKDLSKIILGVGPGSFTGLRIGASVAKTFSYTHSIPIYPISSLKVYHPPIKEGRFGVLLDAKIHGICLQIGEIKNNQVCYESCVYQQNPQDLIEELKDLNFLVCSQKEALLKKLANPIFETKIIECAPSALQMLKEAQRPEVRKVQNALEKLDLKYFDSTKC